MNLGEGWVCKERASFVSAICCGHIASARIRREIKHVAVSAAREHDRIRSVPLDFSRAQVSSDDSLRGNRMRAPRRILKTKTFHLISKLAQCCRGRSTGQAGADDNYFEFSAVVWTYQSDMVPVISPFLSQRPWRNFRIKCSNHALKDLKTTW